MTALPTLKTRRLVLRTLASGDAEVVAALGGKDFEVARWLSGCSWPYEEGDAEGFVEETLASDPLRHEAVFAITLGGVMIGCVGVEAPGDLEELPDYPTLGYWLGTAFHGFGYATEAGAAVLQWAFEAHGCPTIAARVFEGNEASANVLQKLGFTSCGTTERFAKSLNKKVKCTLFCLDRKEFEAARNLA